MKITSLKVYAHEIVFPNTLSNLSRKAFWVALCDKDGRTGWGEIAPLSGWSKETAIQALSQVQQQAVHICAVKWQLVTCLEQLLALRLLPSVHFGIETALLNLLNPLANFEIPSCALLMGTHNEIMHQAEQRYGEGYTVAKLKIGMLSLTQAIELINALKPHFKLRLDINLRWDPQQVLSFCRQFPPDSFDYIEDPCSDLALFTQIPHPIALDETLSQLLNFQQLGALANTNLKALIYKPTLRGGLASALGLLHWAQTRNVQFILSSSFESDIGIYAVSAMAKRLSLVEPQGIGPYHFLQTSCSSEPLHFKSGKAHLPAEVVPRDTMLSQLQFIFGEAL